MLEQRHRKEPKKFVDNSLYAFCGKNQKHPCKVHKRTHFEKILFFKVETFFANSNMLMSQF